MEAIEQRETAEQPLYLLFPRWPAPVRYAWGVLSFMLVSLFIFEFNQAEVGDRAMNKIRQPGMSSKPYAQSRQYFGKIDGPVNPASLVLEFSRYRTKAREVSIIRRIKNEKPKRP